MASDIGLLRLLMCGSVDDGKSTLLGRLLLETGQISDDQAAALARDSRRYGTTAGDLDLALLTDGLEAEREQGITIDVAYRQFATPRRAFIVADTPGHEQYTRNMVTGASTSEFAVILIDARKGVLSQTKRHATICGLLGITRVALAINKIDLIAYDEALFNHIVEDFSTFAAQCGIKHLLAIPVSARDGDNVSALSERTPWYRGPTLLAHLETVDAACDLTTAPFRFRVQRISRPHPDFRGIAGIVASGRITNGDDVAVANSGLTSHIARIVGPDGDINQASAGDAVTLTLERDIDVGRGDVIAPVRERPTMADQFAAHLVWTADEPLLPGRSYLMRIGTRWVPVTVTTIKHKLNVETLEHLAARQLSLNEIGFCNLSTSSAIAFDPYAENRATGAFILVDRLTNATAAAGMISFALHRATNVHRESQSLDKTARAHLKLQKPAVIWFTGLSGSGKSTIAKAVEDKLHALGRHTMMLDGDNLRHGLNRDLGFTDADRVENIRRVGEVAKLMVEAGLIVLCAFISPFKAERDLARSMVDEGEFFEIFIDTPIEECIRRDPKGLYAKANAGAIPNFTGISSPYEQPDRPELTLTTIGSPADELATLVLRCCGYL